MMTPYIDWSSAFRVCPSCPPEVGPQPLENFYVCATRLNKRSSKCKPCQRAQTALHRKQVAMRRVKRKPMQIAPRLTQKERVMQAIEQGCRSQEEIQRATRIRIDDVCMALARLWDEEKLDRAAIRRREYRLKVAA